jgi:Mg/Co/Ni transporter MgtE
MLERYKKMQDGVAKLAALLESSALSKQKNIIKIGINEDPIYINNVLSIYIEWDDVMALRDSALCELLHIAKPGTIAIALQEQPQEVIERFLKACKREVMGKIKDALEFPRTKSPAFIITARMELVCNYRTLVDTKKLPQPQKKYEDVKKKLGI